MYMYIYIYIYIYECVCVCGGGGGGGRTVEFIALAAYFKKKGSECAS